MRRFIMRWYHIVNVVILVLSKLYNSISFLPPWIFWHLVVVEVVCRVIIGEAKLAVLFETMIIIVHI